MTPDVLSQIEAQYEAALEQAIRDDLERREAAVASMDASPIPYPPESYAFWRATPKDLARVALAVLREYVPTSRCTKCAGRGVIEWLDPREMDPYHIVRCSDCVNGRVPSEWRYRLVRQVGAEINDLGQCPYLDRYYGVEGHDPEATCAFGCVDEPECMTCEPEGGWPSRLTLYVAVPVPEPVEPEAAPSDEGTDTP